MLSLPLIVSRLRYQPETDALIARFTTAPSARRAGWMDDLIKALKPGIWDALDALHMFAAEDAQSAYLNWKGPVFDASPVSSPTFTPNGGVQGNGTSSYVDSGFNPATAGGKYAQNSCLFGIWSLTGAVQTGSAAGWFDGTNGTTVLTWKTGDTMSGRANCAASVDAAGSTVTNGLGFRGVARNSSSQLQLVANGAVVASVASTSVAPAAGNFRYGSITAASFNTVKFAAGVIGGYLAGPDKLTLNAALSIYLGRIGAV